MYEFVIGVDRRSGRLGGDLERHLRTTYDYWSFLVEGMRGSISLNSINALSKQTDCLLEGIVDYSAKYYLALSTASILQPSPVGPIPQFVTVLTAVDNAGQVLYDCIEPIGLWVPPSQRTYSKYRYPDLLDYVAAVVHGLSKPEFLSA